MSVWLAALLLLGPSPVRADKRALYGDPTLVPTRAGERARHELALAAAVAAAVGAQADGATPVVEVRLPDADDGGAVVVTGAGVVDPEQVARLAEAVVGPWSVGRVRVFVWPARAAAPIERGLVWPLAAALVGFGASAGIAVDRLRRRRG